MWTSKNARGEKNCANKILISQLDTQFVLDDPHEELDSKVDDLDPTEDGEACEEAHRSSNEAKLGLQGHLLVLLNLVVG